MEGRVSDHGAPVEWGKPMKDTRLRSRSCPGAYSSYLVARPVSTGGLVGASLWTRVVDWYRPGVAPAVLWVSLVCSVGAMALGWKPKVLACGCGKRRSGVAIASSHKPLPGNLDASNATYGNPLWLPSRGSPAQSFFICHRATFIVSDCGVGPGMMCG